MNRWIDTHCHLDLLQEKQSLNLDTYPEKMIQVACHPHTFAQTSTMLEQHSKVWGAFGVHPHEASHYNTQVEEELIQRLQHPRCVAFGEIGLDYHYDFSPRDVQIQVFQRQMELAKDGKLPVVLHTREAEEDTFKLLSNMKLHEMKIHVHCYTGSLEFAQKLLTLDAEIYFGFTGILTFKTAEEIRQVAQCIPMDRLLIETDSPFLAPIPHRGKTADPSMVGIVGEALAKLRQVSTLEMSEILWENSHRCYKKLSDQ